MKKRIALILTVVLCVGLCGCSEAKSVYKSLAKAGTLTRDGRVKKAESISGSGAAGVDRLVFRMPEEARGASVENACFVEVYQNEDDLNAAVGKLNESANAAYYMFSSGNILLLLDANISEETALKYADAMKKKTKQEASARHEKPLLKNAAQSFDYSVPKEAGAGAEAVYKKLKRKLKTQFTSFAKNENNEGLTCSLRSKDGSFYCTLNISARNSEEDAQKLKEAFLNANVKTKKLIFTSGNIVIDTVGTVSDKDVKKISKALKKATGKPVEMVSNMN